MKKETELLTGMSNEAADIIDAFGLKDKCVTRMEFMLGYGEIATLKVWEEMIEGNIDIPKLKIIMRKYKLVKIEDDKDDNDN